MSLAAAVAAAHPSWDPRLGRGAVRVVECSGINTAAQSPLRAVMSPPPLMLESDN